MRHRYQIRSPRLELLVFQAHPLKSHCLIEERFWQRFVFRHRTRRVIEGTHEVARRRRLQQTSPRASNAAARSAGAARRRAPGRSLDRNTSTAPSKSRVTRCAVPSAPSSRAFPVPRASSSSLSAAASTRESAPASAPRVGDSIGPNLNPPVSRPSTGRRSPTAATRSTSSGRSARGHHTASATAAAAARPAPAAAQLARRRRGVTAKATVPGASNVARIRHRLHGLHALGERGKAVPARRQVQFRPVSAPPAVRPPSTNAASVSASRQPSGCSYVPARRPRPSNCAGKPM